MQGKIIKGIAGFYYIETHDEKIYECKAKGIFRKGKKRNPLKGFIIHSSPIQIHFPT